MSQNIHRASCTALLPRLEQVSHCWSCCHPLEGPGAGTALPREQPAFPSLFVSPMNPSQQLWPCLAVLPMCFPLKQGRLPQHRGFALWWGESPGRTWESQTRLSPCPQVLWWEGTPLTASLGCP